MTAEEKKLLQNSARLCGQRKRLLAQIEAENKKKVAVPNVNRRAEKEAEKYIEEQNKKKTRYGSMVKAGLISCPILLGMLIPDGFLALLSLIASGVVFFVVYLKQEKKADEKVKAEFIRENTAKYTEERAQALEHNNQIQKNIMKMQGVLAQIEQSLRDPSKCCLHQDYWYAGEEIYHLVENGRAETLKEAINLFEEIRERDIARAERAQAAENARWAQLQAMMDEGTSKYDERKKQHWEEFEKTALIASILDDDD